MIEGKIIYYCALILHSIKLFQLIFYLFVLCWKVVVMIAHMVTNLVVYAIPYVIFMIIIMIDEDTYNV
jgi:hypothetical protein